MYKIVSALLLILLFAPSPELMSKSRAFAKDRHDFPVLTNKGKMIFSFTVGNISFAPNAPAKYRIYILTPDGKKINGPQLDGQKIQSLFRVIVKPPILFGTYTIVVENLNIPSNTQMLIDKTVFVTNSLNTKVARTTVQAAQNPSAPANPGDTVIGYFNPTPSFFAH